MFRKPSLADIYIDELRSGLDASLVPVFTPDTVVSVGSIGRFTEGRFEPRGHVRDIVQWDPPTVATSATDWSYRSEHTVSLAPQGTVTLPTGTQLLSGKLSLTGRRAVVAAFAGMSEVRVASPRDFDLALWRLYLEEALHDDEVVVWYTRTARSGTVLVNRAQATEVEVLADAALVGGVLSIQGLGVGVSFGSGSQASFQVSGPDLTAFLRTKGLRPGDIPRVEEVRRYLPSHEDAAREFEGVPVPDVRAADLLADVDFAAEAADTDERDALT